MDFVLLPFYSHNQRRFRCNNFKVLAIVRRLSNTQRISSSRFRLAQLHHALTSHLTRNLGRAECIFQFLCLLVYSCNQHWQQCIHFKIISIATRLCNTWQISPSRFWLAQFNHHIHTRHAVCNLGSIHFSEKSVSGMGTRGTPFLNLTNLNRWDGQAIAYGVKWPTPYPYSIQITTFCDSEKY